MTGYWRLLDLVLFLTIPNTQVLQRVRGSRDDEEPAKVITELVIGRDQPDQRFKQHRKTGVSVRTAAAFGDHEYCASPALTTCCRAVLLLPQSEIWQ